MSVAQNGQNKPAMAQGETGRTPDKDAKNQAASADTWPAFDPALFDKWSGLAERSQKIMAEFMAHHFADPSAFQLIDHDELTQAFAAFNQKLLEHPERLIETQIGFMQQSFDLWQSTVNRMLGQPAAPVIAPEPGDRRFKDKAWSDEIVFDYLKQSYLLTSRWIRETVASVNDLDPAAKAKVEFYTRQYLSAAAPSNFALTNPEVMRRAEATDGESLLEGLEHLLSDLEQGRGRLKISMTQERAFQVGKNVAAAPGQVVFENELMQLIQYEPATKSVFDVPLLIIPPWINKFYVLDLQAKNSFVQWLVSQGHTIFVISWANPDERHKDFGFDDYMRLGPLAAMAAIETATGTSKVNLLGFCIGGILLSTTLAYLAQHGDQRVQSATLLATLIDFRDVGEISVFVDEKQLERIEDHVAEHGYLEGHHMADMFSMMRENDLIWSFVVNNYLLGRQPMPFDLLYWNGDSTRLPARMLVDYLRQFYLDNGFMQPGTLTIDNTPIDLGQVKTPVYALATKDDHIAPWQSCYPALHQFGGPVQFTLGGSGHIAGIVNHPKRGKYGFWTGVHDESAPADDAAAWFAHATQHDGSWWPHWLAWLDAYSGGQVPARMPGKPHAGGPGLTPIEPAPGRYVRVKSADLAEQVSLASKQPG